MPLLERFDPQGNGTIGFEAFQANFGPEIQIEEKCGLGISFSLRPGETAEEEERPPIRVERFRERDRRAYQQWHHEMSNYRYDQHQAAEQMAAHVASDTRAESFPARGQRRRREREVGKDPISGRSYSGSDPLHDKEEPYETQASIGQEQEMEERWESPSVRDPWVRNPVRQIRGTFSESHMVKDYVHHQNSFTGNF